MLCGDGNYLSSLSLPIQAFHSEECRMLFKTRERATANLLGSAILNFVDSHAEISSGKPICVELANLVNIP